MGCCGRQRVLSWLAGTAASWIIAHSALAALLQSVCARMGTPLPDQSNGSLARSGVWATAFKCADARVPTAAAALCPHRPLAQRWLPGWYRWERRRSARGGALDAQLRASTPQSGPSDPPDRRDREGDLLPAVTCAGDLEALTEHQHRWRRPPPARVSPELEPTTG